MYKIGIVGTGIIAAAHIDAIAKNADCSLAAVCDIDVEKATKLAGNTVPCFSDYRDMCETVQIDAVIINLPHYLHCEVSKYFLNRGVNVLCEKPMANSVAECDEMLAAAKKSGAVLAIGHVQRYFYAYRVIKEYIKSGKLGRLTRITETRNIDYFPKRPAWFLKKSLAGGGICMNYGAHSLDKLFYTTELGVKGVYACLSNKLTNDDVEAGAQILFELEDGISASVTYCGCHVKGLYETVFYFTNGAIKAYGNGDKAYVSDGGEYEEIVGDGDERSFMEKQLCEFVKLLRGEKSEMASAEYGRKIICVLEQLYDNKEIHR